MASARDLAWASDRVAMLQQMVRDRGAVIYMTEEMAKTICNLAENDPRVQLIQAKYNGMPLADLKQSALLLAPYPNEKTERTRSLSAPHSGWTNRHEGTQ
jgi:hypothetical protein